MSKTIYLLILTGVISSSAYSQGIKKGYKLTGQLSGFADSTLIFLGDNDSTFIINNQFQFGGSSDQSAKQIVLHTKGFSDYKFLWLENSSMTFKAEKGKFREATILGSKTQHEQDQLDLNIKIKGNEKVEDISFIRKHPNSIISAETLSVYASTWGKDTASLLYNKLSSNIKNTSYGKNIFEFITLNRNVKVGDKYVDFTEPNIQGKNVSLSDFKGKIVLLEFWGSWCGPCRAGNPELVRIYNEFKNNDFEILGVASDEKKEFWIEAVKKDSLTWQNVSDLKGDKNKAALIYGVSYYPTNFLIDGNGIIVAKDLRGEALRDKLQELLKK